MGFINKSKNSVLTYSFTKKLKQIFALIISAVLLLSNMPMNVLAAGSQDTGGLCEHHIEHSYEVCGYYEGMPCNHTEHSEDACYRSVTKCVHEHSDDCYPAEAEAAEPNACTHECSRESGCIKKELDCPHEKGQHDEACSYKEAAFCTYECEECQTQDSGNQELECVCTEPCTEGSINQECSVCGAVGANLSQCAADFSLKNEIIVEGTTNWSEIETKLKEILENEPDAQVKIIGKGDEPTIMFDKGDETDSRQPLIVKIKTDMVFENVTLTSGYETTAPDVYLCAYGHRLTISSTVQVQRNATGRFHFTIYGGGYNESVENTYLYIDGGGFANIIGGSYGANSKDSYVYVGKTVDVGIVIGGSHGGVSEGNIEVVYAAENGEELLKRNGVRRIIGGSVDISNSEQKADCTGEYIKVTIEDGALVTDVRGALNSMVHCNDIYINVEKGAAVTRFIEGGAGTSKGVPGFYPANGYDPYYGSFYETHSNIHIRMDGEGRLSDKHEYSAEIIGGATNGDIYGNIDVILNGAVESLVGGCYNGDVTGNIDITVNGQVKAGGSNADWEIGNVPQWFDGYVNAGCFEGTLTGNTKTTIGKDGVVYAVLGGCDNGAMIGDAQIHVYGKVIKGDRDEYKNADRLTQYSGSIFGGSYMTSSGLDVSKQEGDTKVIVYDGATVEGDVYGGGCYTSLTGNSNVIVSGQVNGNVYGGGLVPDGYSLFASSGKVYYIGYVSENSYVELNGNASANDVYGAGCFGDIFNGEIVLKDNATVQNVCGTGNSYYKCWRKGTEYTYVQKSVPCSDVQGDVSISIQDNAVVKDAIYGYKFYTSQKGTTEKAVDGKAEVFFEHSTGDFKRVENADLVQVTDSSKVMIDNEHQDDAQLVNVSDLTIDEYATLTLGANAHILGNYQGDKIKSGTLTIPAGKCLTADGTVTNLTKISIYDYNGVIPAKAQIYVVSGAGSTTNDGDFTWVDTRNGVYMDWKVQDNKTSTQWWLVNNPNPENHGNLTVSKEVAGDAGEKNKSFKFTVTLSDTSIGGTYGDMIFKDGVATFTLKHGESKTATGLSVGISYTVTEDDANQDGYATSSTGESGIITTIGATAAFTNTKNVTPPNPDPTPKTGGLIVSKTVSGNRGDTSKDFRFTVTLGDTSINGKYGDMTFHDGVAVFTLKHGQNMKATGLPAGIRYTVTESDNAGYTVTSTGETGSIIANDTVVALFNNHKSGGSSESDTVNVSVKKVWKLDDGGKAADSVTVVLLRDGKEYKKVELSDQNGWTCTWTGLSDGYTWTVAEVNVPDGFTSKVNQNGMTFTIINDDTPTDSDEPSEPNEPTNPSKPEEPGTPEKPTLPDDTPKTGDESNLTLWLVLMIFSGSAMISILLLCGPRYKTKHYKAKTRL